MESVLEAVGRTPLVRLARVVKGVRPSIYAKLEMFSPTGSPKDRVYFHMFRRAIEDKSLRKGMEVLECVTGNSGVACAWASTVMGFPCTLVMPEGMSEERKKMIRAYGATIISTPGAESDLDLSLQKIEEIRQRSPKKYYIPKQFDNPANPEAHYLTTGPELWEQMNGEIDVFVCTMGTGGMVSGIGRFLREKKPDVMIFAAEPAECPLLSRQEWGPHKIEGIGVGFIPRNLQINLLNGVVTVSGDEAIDMARRLPVEEGVFCGISSGANIVAAQKLARKFPKASSIVTVIYDSGSPYFSTEIFGASRPVDIPQRRRPLDVNTLTELNRFQSDWVIVE